jgi:hypothetical protein
VIIADNYTVGTNNITVKNKNNRKTSHIHMEQNVSVNGTNHVINLEKNRAEGTNHACIGNTCTLHMDQ